MGPRDTPTGAPSKSTLSFDEARVRHAIAASALARAVSKVNLPPVAAPSLDGLIVEVPPPQAPTSEELLAALEEEIAFRIPLVPKPHGAPAALGDLVTADILAFALGTILPNLTLPAAQFELEPDSVEPGFGTALVGRTVGSHFTFTLKLPPDHRLEPLRNAEATFQVHLKEAAAVTPPPGDVDSPEFLRALGLPEDPEEVMDLIAEEWISERESQHCRQQLEQLLPQLLSRAPVVIPESAVDALLGGEWMESQGRFLSAQNVSAQDQEFAARAWLENTDLRERTKRRIHTLLVVTAIAREHSLADYPENELLAYVESTAESAGLDSEEPLEALASNPEFRESAHYQFVWMRTLDFLLSPFTVPSV